MKPGVYNCRVYENVKLGDAFYSMAFKCPEIAQNASPGQFVHISCGDSRILRRPVSICDADGDMIRIVYELKGTGTQWLAECVIGDILDILGPLGNGFTDVPEGRLLLAGGGVGTAPLLFAARKYEGSSAALGFQTVSKAILLSEFAGACESVEISTDDGSLGKKGFVIDIVKNRLETGAYDALLACGPVPMLKAVAAAASELNTPCYVSMEQRMACGVGACLVCSCKTIHGYERACADGPVFNAKEVIWDEA